MKNTEIIFIGPFPPVINGQSISTKHLAKKLSDRGFNIHIIDVGNSASNHANKILLKFLKNFNALISILMKKNKIVYISVNANLGIYISITLAYFAKLRGHNIFLHHHTRSHITDNNWRLNLLGKAAGKNSVHIGLCATMCSNLKLASNYVVNTITYSNVGVVENYFRSIKLKELNKKSYTLGIFGNITLEKGLSRAIDAFRLAYSNNKLAKRLVIGGPITGEYEKSLVNQAKQEFGENLVLLGPIYDREKIKFFEEIDVFLFPSLYSNETQGIVNLEALAAGIPVLAFSICCTPDDLQGKGCKTVSTDLDFSMATYEFLQELSIYSTELARNRFDQLRNSNKDEFEKLVGLIIDKAQ